MALAAFDAPSIRSIRSSQYRPSSSWPVNCQKRQMAPGDPGLLPSRGQLFEGELSDHLEHRVACLPDRDRSSQQALGEQRFDARVDLAICPGAPHFEYEIVDATADVRGDVVIFTYDVHPTDPATGEAVPRWMVTKVMNKTDDGWEVIHTHYGLPAPSPEA